MRTCTVSAGREPLDEAVYESERAKLDKEARDSMTSQSESIQAAEDAAPGTIRKEFPMLILEVKS